MTLNKIEIVVYTLIFLVPGFIIHSTFSILSPRRTETKDLLVLRFLTFSTLNVILWLWLIRLILVRDWINQHPFWTLGSFFVITFVSPVILGLVIGFLDEKDILRKFVRGFKLHSMHSVPTAWDYKFSEITRSGTGRWLVITTSDNDVFGGWYCSKSLASSDAKERDIYLETAWRVKDDVWTALPNTDGVLVRSKDIDSIYFYLDDTAEPIIDPIETVAGKDEDAEENEEDRDAEEDEDEDAEEDEDEDAEGRKAKHGEVGDKGPA